MGAWTHGALAPLACPRAMDHAKAMGAHPRVIWRP